MGRSYAGQWFLLKPCMSVIIIVFLYHQNSYICCFSIKIMNRSESVKKTKIQLFNTKCYFRHKSLFIVFV